MGPLRLAKSEAAKALPILGACIIVLLFLGWTGLGFVQIGPGRYIDMLIVPAIFAAMIGGLWAGIPTALLWGVLAYYNSPIITPSHWFYLALAVITTTIAAYSYKWAKRWWPGDPMNVYRAIVATITVHSLFRFLTFDTITLKEFAAAIFTHAIPECAVTIIIMWAVIDKLRQLHILNGIKKEEEHNDALDLS